MSWLMYATRSITRTIRPSSVLRQRRAAGVARDPVAHLLGQVQPRAVALEVLDDPQRVLVVAEVAPEALFQAAVQHLLADVPERRMAEVVAEADRLHQILVQAQRARHRARDRRHLERVRQPRAVVVAARRHEHLRLVRQPAEGLAVDDPVAVALERRAQRAVVLRARPQRRVGARRQRREQPLLLLGAALREAGCDRLLLGWRCSRSIVRSRRGRRPAAAHVARVSSRRAASPLVHPVVPPFSSPGILVEHRRPAARLGQALRGRASRCAGPRRVRAATPRRRPPRSACPARAS